MTGVARPTITAKSDPSVIHCMGKRSSGILPYRRHNGAWQVLLVHPGGPFWARKDLGVWSIAKGEYLPPEPALDAAVREFEEETGHRLSGPFVALRPVRLKSGKVVDAWATEADWDLSTFRSNTFEFVDAKGAVKRYAEVDRIEWFPFDVAAQKINPGQVPLVMELQARLDAE